VVREVTLEFDKGNSGFTLRHQANERARDIGQDILKQLQGSKAPRTTEAPITLRGVRAPDLRTGFFVNLMEGLPGYKTTNVTSVGVVRAAPEVSPDEETDENSNESEEAREMLSVVRKAVFDGDKLLNSKPYLELEQQGFFISRAVWRCRDTRMSDPPEVELESDFEDAQNCDGFRYDVRGVYEQRSRGESGLKKTRAAASADVRVTLIRALEASAREALRVALNAAATEAADGPDGEVSGDEP